MKTDLLEIEPDETLKQRRAWYALALILFVLSAVLQESILFLAALFTLLVGLVPDLWYRLALRHLLVRQAVDHQHAFFGEDVTLSISIENQKLLPLPWLQVENKITPPLALIPRKTSRLQMVRRDTLSSTWLLWSFQRVTRHYRMRCEERGFHTFGPVRLSSSDPFGWLESDLTVPASVALLVYPLVVPVQAFGLAPVNPLGENVLPRPLLEDPLRVSGIRDYVLGDDPRRIHWKATAHAGELKSKIYEPPALRRLLILLDVWNYDQRTEKTDPEMQEFTISAAASLAMWALDEGYMVGLLANGALAASRAEQEAGKAKVQETMQQVAAKRDVHRGDGEILPLPEVVSGSARVPFASDPKQYELLLSTLARLVPQYNSSIRAVIDMDDEMFPDGTTILLVSAASSLDEETVERLLELRRRNNAVYLALTNDLDEENLTPTYGLPVHFLGGKEHWRELLKAVGEQKSATNNVTSTAVGDDASVGAGSASLLLG
ncbi:MAG TPA: DUF58 domain-containing protein [Ktedonobacteraceae bacterium]|nr:DUF58 domain-containing protein [Ktedonobacteraceae bacterium]